MFERFTKDARAVVAGAVEHATQARAAETGADHLLLALLDASTGRASSVLAALGARDRREGIVGALEEARRRGGLSQAEAEALAGLGIDLAAIVSRVEDVHGVGAMAAGAGGRGHREKGRLTGHQPLADDAKDILRRSLRIAVARRDRHIGAEHLLLALLARPGIPTEVLADHGVTYAEVERILSGDEAGGFRATG